MEFCSATGAESYDAIVSTDGGLLVALDFDGTLSPIVDDPEVALIHPRAHDVLVGLAARVRAIAVVTGRPARQVLALGGLDEVGDAIGEGGRELVVLGQYGNERWTSAERRVVSPKPPAGLASFIGDLPRLFRRADVADAWVEEKGLAVAVHTRRSADPRAAFDRLLPVLADAAAERHLTIEPGRLVIEVRAPGMDKGIALRRLVEEFHAEGIVFVGDDLGDMPAFQTVLTMRKEGLAALLVCSGSDEESALRPLSDLVVPGPDGVMDFLAGMTGAIAAR